MPAPAHEDTDRFAAAIATGDADAFGQWLACVEARVRRSLRGFAAQVDVEAVLQEAFLRVWHVASRFVRDERPDGLLRLCLRIARNLAVSETRRLRTAPVTSLGEDADLDAFAVAIGREAPEPFLVSTLADCRKGLPNQPGKALAARLDNAGAEPDQTVAERLGMRLNTFLQNITRARRLLAECLRRRGIDLAQEWS
jgi:DNA-directed RNA polymerase specialized sigma24 family protein